MMTDNHINGDGKEINGTTGYNDVGDGTMGDNDDDNDDNVDATGDGVMGYDNNVDGNDAMGSKIDDDGDDVTGDKVDNDGDNDDYGDGRRQQGRWRRRNGRRRDGIQ
jgi:hypothetical protein